MLIILNTAVDPPIYRVLDPGVALLVVGVLLFMFSILWLWCRSKQRRFDTEQQEEVSRVTFSKSLSSNQGSHGHANNAYEVNAEGN